MFDFFFERVVMLSLSVSSRNGNRLERPDKIRIASQAPTLLDPTAKRYPLNGYGFEHEERALLAVSQVRQLHWCCLLCSVLLLVTARREESRSKIGMRLQRCSERAVCLFPPRLLSKRLDRLI